MVSPGESPQADFPPVPSPGFSTDTPATGSPAGTDGRIRQRRRLTLVSGTTAVMMLAAVGDVACAATPTAARTALPTAASEHAAPARLDPTHLVFTVGRTPEVFEERSVQTTRYSQSVGFAHFGPYGDPAGLGTVTFYAAGAGWDTRWDDQGFPPNANGKGEHRGTPKGEPGPTVDGHPSIWLATERNTVGLAWQWAPGAYALAAISRSVTDHPRDTLRTMVDSVRARRHPLTMPFRASRPPKKLTLRRGYIVSESNGGYEVSLTFAPRGDHSDPDQGLPSTVRYEMYGTKYDSPNPHENVTINGHPGWVVRYHGGESTWFTVHGAAAEVDASDPTSLRLLGGTDSTIRYARTMKPVADPADRSTWVAPLR